MRIAETTKPLLMRIAETTKLHNPVTRLNLMCKIKLTHAADISRNASLVLQRAVIGIYRVRFEAND